MRKYLYSHKHSFKNQSAIIIKNKMIKKRTNKKKKKYKWSRKFRKIFLNDSIKDHVRAVRVLTMVAHVKFAFQSILNISSYYTWITQKMNNVLDSPFLNVLRIPNLISQS